MKLRGTKQWAPNERNRFLGCLNNCRYCYAKKKMIRFHKKTEENWKEMKPNRLQSTRKTSGRIMFPTTHDLHIETKDVWFPFLKELLQNGNEVLIVSKPQFEAIQYICENLSEYKDRMEFRFTIGCLCEETRAFWEPGAPTMCERVRALKLAYLKGFKTSVSMEPLLTEIPEATIKCVKPWVTGTIWIGMMNHMSRQDFMDKGAEIWYERLMKINSRENIQKIYDQFKDDPQIRWKDSIQDMLGLQQGDVE